MGTTGSSDKEGINKELPAIIARVRENTSAYLAVGFGVSNRGHFQYVANANADGVVIGSRVVQIIKNAPQGRVEEEVQQFCAGISGQGLRSPACISNVKDARVISSAPHAVNSALHPVNGALHPVNGATPSTVPFV